MRAVFRYTAACCAGCPVTESLSKKILRESRSELLKPLCLLPNFAAEKQKKGQNMKVITIESSAFTASDGTDSRDSGLCVPFPVKGRRVFRHAAHHSARRRTC